LQDIRSVLPRVSLYVGSGATVEMLTTLCRIATGAIVGTAAKVDGAVTNPVDPDRVRALRAAADRR